MKSHDRNMHNEIAEGEAWLSRFETQPLDADVLARIKTAVRDELVGANAPAARSIAFVPGMVHLPPPP
ncbi:MAG: hypothetical protein IPK83_21600 [Planctomycetes bacterium]|nr:hypothetical protein [Planctomycetota bacterium]